MPLKDNDMHVMAGFGTLVLAGLLVVPTVIISGGRANASDDDNKLDDMVSIEASIAFQKQPQPKQPQKPHDTPEPTKIDGVSHDADQKPPPKKDDDKKPDKQQSVDDVLNQFHHGSDEPGKTVPDLGSFDGTARGFGDETKGDPYFGQLSADLHNAWEYPQILNASGTPVGCVHLSADGKVADIKLWDRTAAISRSTTPSTTR